MFDHFRGLRHFKEKMVIKQVLKGSYLGNKKPIKELINFLNLRIFILLIKMQQNFFVNKNSQWQ